MTSSRRRLDDNLHLFGDEVHCTRCDALVGTAASWLEYALTTERPAQEQGGSLMRAAPSLYVDSTIVFRQACCPGCSTALLTETTTDTDRHVRTKRITSLS